MKLDITTTNGTLYDFKFSRTGIELANYYFWLFFGIAVALMFLLISYLLLSLNTIPALVFFIFFATSLLAIWFTRLITRPLPLSIDTVNRILHKSKREYRIPVNSLIVQDRLFHITGSGKNRRKVISWKISFDVGEGKQQEIYNFKGSHNRNNCPWIDETAETIAELLNITLIDRTGFEEVTRNPGETDKPLVTLLRQRKQAESSQKTEHAPVIPKELHDRLAINRTGHGFDVISLHTPIGYLSYFLFGLGVILIGAGIFFDLLVLVFGTTVFNLALGDFQGQFNGDDPLPVWIGFFFVLLISAILVVCTNVITIGFGYKALDSVAGMTTVEITPENISVREKKLLGTKIKGTIPLHKVERLLLVETWNDFTVEFMSDEGRILLPGNYGQEEAALLRNVLEHLLVQL
ncbi:MAG: hypothetical protein ACFFD4_24675 [Candidatus Odinarchaeota archaeon]